MTATALWLLGVNPLPSPTPPPASAFGAGVFGFSVLLSVLVWAPALGAALVALVPAAPGRPDRRFLGIAFWTNAGVVLVLAVIGYQQFQAFVTGIQFEERLPWLPGIGASYHLGVDGAGMSLLLLNAVLGVAAVLASWRIRHRVREYFTLLLLVEAGLNGVVAARDFFVLFLFWAALAVPVALLVAGWGGSRGAGSAVRLAAYWSLGSAALLAAGLLIYAASGASSFDLDVLAKAAPGARVQVVAGILIVVAAATRLPLAPLHGWAGNVLAEAPAGVAILVAGAAGREGGHLLLRLLAGSLHEASHLLAPLLAALAGATVIYAALAALGTADIRRFGAYLAMLPGGIAALGVAGLTPLALDGAALSLFAGGLAAALVVGVAATIAERAQTRSMLVASGLGARMPKLSWILLAAGLAVLGLPFMATFPAGLMVIFGAARTQPAAVFAVGVGLAVAAMAIARILQRAVFGAPNPDAPPVADSSLDESWYLGILVGALLWVGLIPGGPKLAGIPLFDPGLVNVVNSAMSELSSSYAPPAPPAPPPAARPKSPAGGGRPALPGGPPP